MSDEQYRRYPRAAESLNSLVEGLGPDQADLLDRVLDKGVQVDPIDQIAVISGSVSKLDPFIVPDRETADTGRPSDNKGADADGEGEQEGS
jgi:hypothetical protein